MSGGLTPDEQQTIEMTGAVGYYENRQEAEKKENAGKPSSTPEKNQVWTFRGSKLLAVLSSLRLAISLFLILAFLTIFGTFIEQGRDAP
ncbi:hypothetical protein B1B_08667, partial [mine drainage metagenome]